MKRLNILPFAVLVFSLSGLAFADYESEIRDLKMQKEKLNSEIQNLNTRIASTDSMLRADASHRQLLEQRYKADVERRNLEIDLFHPDIPALPAAVGPEDGCTEIVNRKKRDAQVVNFQIQVRHVQHFRRRAHEAQHRLGNQKA